MSDYLIPPMLLAEMAGLASEVAEGYHDFSVRLMTPAEYARHRCRCRRCNPGCWTAPGPADTREYHRRQRARRRAHRKP